MLDSKGYGIAFTPGSQYRVPISSAILKLQVGPALHYTTRSCTTLPFITQYFTNHNASLPNNKLHNAVLHNIILHNTAFSNIIFHNTALVTTRRRGDSIY